MDLLLSIQEMKRFILEKFKSHMLYAQGLNGPMANLQVWGVFLLSGSQP